MIEVSIIIPYFRKRKYIIKALRSIENQSLQKYEVIIVYDDNNLDDYIFIKNIIKNKKNFYIIKNNKNMGAGFSRNLGIKKSKGVYVAFLDADDYWHKKKLEYQIQFMKKNECIISHTDYKIIYTKPPLKEVLRKAKILDYKTLLNSCDIGLSTVIVKRSILKENNNFPKLKTKEDFVLWLEILKKNNCRILPLNKPLTFWRITENSLSSNFSQKIKDSYKVYNVYCKFNFIKSLFYVFILSFNALLKKAND